jgi:hypothetical protein
MPNGGSDCSGTCWFSAKNKGEAGYTHSRDPEPAFCSIRGLTIEDPFYSYCANHPHRRPEQDLIPIGPVFIGDSSGARLMWQRSPDTEEVRQHLLSPLAEMEERAFRIPDWRIRRRGDRVAVRRVPRVARHRGPTAPWKL